MYPQIESDAVHLAGVSQDQGITAAVLELNRISEARELTMRQCYELKDMAAAHIRNNTNIQES